MKVDAIIKWFLPREERFNELLAKDTANLVGAVKAFVEIARSTSLDERAQLLEKLKAIEHEGDAITRQIFDALNSTFITPFDREDIRSMAVDLDDILDYVEAAAGSLVLFELSASPESLKQFGDILIDMVTEVDRITGLIWDRRNESRIHDSIVRVSDLENRADLLYNRVIAELFRGDSSKALEILKWKEVYQGLEDACDACKDFTHVIGNIMVKNA
jgi:uncharacterized protein